jgi:RNA polymerase sigma factor (sigma-70 family)
LLTRITVGKCARTSGRPKERPRHVSLAIDSDSSSFDLSLGWKAIAREPSPAETAELNDTIDSLLKPLRESQREIVTLALRGYTQVEIGNCVGCSERTVRRVLTQAHADLEKLDRLENEE